jgi:hypothetical protein
MMCILVVVWCESQWKLEKNVWPSTGGKCEIQKKYQQKKTFKQGQMEFDDAKSGLSWTVVYEVAKTIFPKILPSFS